MLSGKSRMPLPTNTCALSRGQGRFPGSSNTAHNMHVSLQLLYAGPSASSKQLRYIAVLASWTFQQDLSRMNLGGVDLKCGVPLNLDDTSCRKNRLPANETASSNIFLLVSLPFSSISVANAASIMHDAISCCGASLDITHPHSMPLCGIAPSAEAGKPVEHHISH